MEETEDGEEVESEDFEFRVSVSGGLRSSSSAADDMCVADEVFFRGQMLPLRPCGDRGASRSRSSSNSRSTSRSSSGGRSCGGSSGEPPRAPAAVSNNFYAHPSPTPRVLSAGRTSAGWRSASAAPPGWGAIFRLGVAKAPEIDIRSRGSASGRKKVAPARWSCKCLPDAAEPTAVSNSADRKKKDQTRRD